jgi:5-(carboxyamino)imidazole ribonucleotide mutase
MKPNKSKFNKINMSKIIIIMGSKSDKDFALKIKAELKKYKVKIIEHVASAHKVPELVLRIVKKYNASKDNICYITIAGRSNGLSGVTAANAIHPVIACPPFKDKRDYQINIHSTLQMPSQTPVLTVVDPKNAAEAAVRILGNGDAKLKQQIGKEIKKMKKSFK